MTKGNELPQLDMLPITARQAAIECDRNVTSVLAAIRQGRIPLPKGGRYDGLDTKVSLRAVQRWSDAAKRMKPHSKNRPPAPPSPPDTRDDELAIAVRSVLDVMRAHGIDKVEIDHDGDVSFELREVTTYTMTVDV